MKQRPIIVFDSGFGGISVLHRLVEVMPNETFLYFGDSANAPYGPRPQSQVEELTVSAVLALLPQDPKAVVIACNTATAAALPALQRALPHIPVIGIQPAVAQAAADGAMCWLWLPRAPWPRPLSRPRWPPWSTPNR